MIRIYDEEYSCSDDYKMCVWALVSFVHGDGVSKFLRMRRISEKKFIFKMGNEHSVAYLVYKV